MERGAGGEPLVSRAADAGKDQSYMLAMLERDVRERIVFPLGDLHKERVRALAREAGLPGAQAVESQEVCFVGEGGYAPFLERTGGMEPRIGPIEDEAGRLLGTHGGYWRFTVGQRKGIGVAGAEPLYVLATDAARNAVVVGPRERLATRSVSLGARARARGAGRRSPRGARPLPRPGPARARPHRLREACTSTSSIPPTGSPPGQTAALYRAVDWSRPVRSRRPRAPRTRTGGARSGLV